MKWIGMFMALLILAGCSSSNETHSNISPTVSTPSSRDKQIFASVYGMDEKTAWVGGDGFIAKTQDGGQTWSTQYTGPTWIRSLQFVDATYGWALGRDQLLATSDGGNHWVPVHEPKDLLWDVKFLNSSFGYGITKNALPPQTSTNSTGTTEGQLVISNDGGNSWKTVSTPSSVETSCFTNNQSGWVIGDGILYQTADGGGTWKQLSELPPLKTTSSQLTGKASKLSCPSSSTLWVRVTYGRGAGAETWSVYRVTDAGSSWTTIAGNITGVEHHSAAVTGPWAVVNENVVRMTGSFHGNLTFEGLDNAGQQWVGGYLNSSLQVVNNTDTLQLNAVPRDLHFSSAKNGWQIIKISSTGESVVLRTTDGGITWNRSGTPS